jgi:hypothetical protein
MWWLALVAAIIIGRSISLGTVLRVLGWAAIILTFALFALGHAPGPIATPSN